MRFGRTVMFVLFGVACDGGGNKEGGQPPDVVGRMLVANSCGEGAASEVSVAVDETLVRIEVGEAFSIEMQGQTWRVSGTEGSMFLMPSAFARQVAFEPTGDGVYEVKLSYTGGDGVVRDIVCEFEVGSTME